MSVHRCQAEIICSLRVFRLLTPFRKSCRLPVLASSATPEPKIIACNATQTRTHIPDRATVISIRKYTDVRRNTGPRTQVWPSDNSRTGQLHGEKKHE